MEIFTLLLTLQNENTGREEIATTCKIPYLPLDRLVCRLIRKNSLGPWQVILLRAAKVNKAENALQNGIMKKIWLSAKRIWEND